MLVDFAEAELREEPDRVGEHDDLTDLERAQPGDLRLDERAADAAPAPRRVHADRLQLGARAPLVADFGPQTVTDRADEGTVRRLGHQKTVDAPENVAQRADDQRVRVGADERVDAPRVSVAGGPDPEGRWVVLHGAEY